jgi:hypothetical protein
MTGTFTQMGASQKTFFGHLGFEIAATIHICNLHTSNIDIRDD